MSSKVLLDVNVCLDVLLDRKPFVSYSGRIFEVIEQGDIEGIISSLSFDTLFYIMRPAVGSKKALEGLQLLLEFLSVGTVGTKVVEHALKADWKDLEDALQYYCAVFAECDYVVTRNVGDFKPVSSTEVVSPEDFLSHL